MNIIGKTWFSTLDGALIGIVVVQPSIGKPKAYIGIGVGRDEDTDAACIAQMGAKFPAAAARVFFPHIKEIVD